MTRIALKEWAVAVRAMEQGLQDVIFRKGGIQEPYGDFQLDHSSFYLYPAREHQKSGFLKPENLPLLETVESQQSGHIVSIRSKATVVACKRIYTLDEAEAYQQRHVWNNDFIQMRLDYKPDRPLYVIELEIELLRSPVEFVEPTEYVGCKSWVELQPQHTPVLL